METIHINTTLHCQNCVNKVAPHLDQADNISSWEIDTNSTGKTLTVKGEGITPSFLNSLLEKEGYSVASSNGGQSEEVLFWLDNSKWKRASFNTLNCLIGCSIGDFGMIIYLQAYYPESTMALQMGLAIIAGLTTSIILESIILRVREKFNWVAAFKTAFGMSFISMVGMEIAMNTTDFIITGGKAAFDNPMYWVALGIAMIAGFIAPLPYNYYKLKKYNQACH